MVYENNLFDNCVQSFEEKGEKGARWKVGHLGFSKCPSLVLKLLKALLRYICRSVRGFKTSVGRISPLPPAPVGPDIEARARLIKDLPSGIFAGARIPNKVREGRCKVDTQLYITFPGTL